MKAEKYITISKILYIKWPYMTSDDVWGQALDHYEKYCAFIILVVIERLIKIGSLISVIEFKKFS